MAAAMLFLAGCRVTNYAEPAQPFYATHDGVARDKEPGLRVVTFNVKEGEKIAETIAALGQHPDLRDADIVVLQEMNAEGVAAVARALRMNSAYFPRPASRAVDGTGGTRSSLPGPSKTRTRSSCPISAASAGAAGRQPASSSAMARAPSACIRRIWARPGTRARAAGATRPSGSSTTRNGAVSPWSWPATSTAKRSASFSRRGDTAGPPAARAPPSIAFRWTTSLPAASARPLPAGEWPAK